MSDRPPVRPWPPRAMAVLVAVFVVLAWSGLREDGAGRPPTRLRTPYGDGMMQVIDVRHRLRIGVVEVVWQVASRRPFVTFAEGAAAGAWRGPTEELSDGRIRLRSLAGDAGLELDPSTLVEVAVATDGSRRDIGRFDLVAALDADLGGGIRWPALVLALVGGTLHVLVLACGLQFAWARFDAWRHARGAAAGEPIGPRCPECGYALVGSTADRCPECGHAVAPDERD